MSTINFIKTGIIIVPGRCLINSLDMEYLFLYSMFRELPHNNTHALHGMGIIPGIF